MMMLINSKEVFTTDEPSKNSVDSDANNVTSVPLKEWFQRISATSSKCDQESEKGWKIIFA